MEAMIAEHKKLMSLKTLMVLSQCNQQKHSKAERYAIHKQTYFHIDDEIKWNRKLCSHTICQSLREPKQNYSNQ